MKYLTALLLATAAVCAAASQGPVVNLGYASYEGVRNSSTGLNTFKGVRYGAPPTGQNRWRAPLPPAQNETTIPQPAFNRGPQCPKADRAPYTEDPCPDLQNESTLPARCANTTTFQRDFLGDEDCLFLDVYAPSNGTGLPVFVYIHGGGYGEGDGTTDDQSDLINKNNNSFIGVSISFRLGVFGFLSSDEVKRKGVVNAGLLDMLFALQWVQEHIDKFGGDPTKVSIGGESSGGGSVMLLNMAYGGELGTKLWNNTIASSPYLPMQYGYADFPASQSYYAFAAKVGCFDGTPYGNTSHSILDCLRGRDSLILQQAGAIVSGTGRYGTWSFLPVTDGDLLRTTPSAQLATNKLNGRRMLTTNDANEAPAFTPPNIRTEADFRSYLDTLFPLFTNADIAELLHYYPSPNTSANSSTPLFATTGTAPPTTLNQSTFATGQQQRAMAVYAETTFICPSYWLADAYAPAAHRYQYSVPPANHGGENPYVFGPRPNAWSPQFDATFKTIWGNLVTRNDPSLTPAQAAAFNAAPAAAWPAWDPQAPQMLNLNQTGGVPVQITIPLETTSADDARLFNFTTTQFMYNNGSTAGPSGLALQNALAVVDAASWEGGRGARCEFWRRVAARVPE